MQIFLQLKLLERIPNKAHTMHTQLTTFMPFFLFVTETLLLTFCLVKTLRLLLQHKKLITICFVQFIFFPFFSLFPFFRFYSQAPFVIASTVQKKDYLSLRHCCCCCCCCCCCSGENQQTNSKPTVQLKMKKCHCNRCQRCSCCACNYYVLLLPWTI